MGALGDSFRTARESQGLMLSEVAERTHIRSAYLMAIEAEDWTAIGPPVYVRGFLRSYARCLGLDGDSAVARFADNAHAGTHPPARATSTPVRRAPAVARQVPTDVRRSPTRGEPTTTDGADGPLRGLSLGAIAGVLVAVALVVFVGYQYADYQRARGTPVGTVRSAASAEPVAQPGRAARGFDDSTAAPALEIHSSRPVDERPSVVAVRLRDSSWLRVVVDGKVTMEGLYPSGTARTFVGRSATVRVGNAGGVNLFVDGKDLGPMGGLGDVAERSFQL